MLRCVDDGHNRQTSSCLQCLRRRSTRDGFRKILLESEIPHSFYNVKPSKEIITVFCKSLPNKDRFRQRQALLGTATVKSEQIFQIPQTPWYLLPTPLSIVTAASKPSSVRVGPNHKRLSIRLQRTPTSFTVPYKSTIQMLLLITFHN